LIAPAWLHRIAALRMVEDRLMKNVATMFRFALLMLLAAAAAGCSGYRPAPAAFHEVLNYPYVLGEGDKVRITVFDQQGLSNTYAIDQSGFIAFPLVGAVPARGLTAQQLEGKIATALMGGFVRSPDVTVEIDTYRPVFIMGEVGASGQYAFVPGMTVQKAVAAAGGFNARANQSNVDITRQINGKLMTGRVLITDPILPGDTIYIRERVF
jgi:polysaccharide biosynthesis/export protein